MSLLSALGLSLCVLGTDHSRFHPSDVDLFVEIPRVQLLVEQLRAAPASRFIDDPQVQKLGEMTQQLGFDMGSLVRGAIPRISSNAPESALYAPGDLGDVTISWSGLDPVPGAQVELSKRAGLVMVCDFASETDASRMTAALREARWLEEVGDPSSGEPLMFEYAGIKHSVERHRFKALTVELDAWSVRIGTRWILGAGSQTTKGVSDRVDGDAPALLARDVLFGSERVFSSSAGVVVARVYANLESTPFVSDMDASGVAGSLITTLIPFAGSKGLWRIELRGERFVTESVRTRQSPATALEQLYGKLPVTEACARYIPKEAVGAWIIQLQPENFRRALEEILPSTEAEPNASEELAPKIDAAFAQGLGTNAAVAVLPITSLPVGGSGSLMPRVLVTVQLKDRAAFQSGLAELVTRSRSRRPKLVVEDRPYHKIPITVFSQAAAEDREEGSTPGATNPLASMLSSEAEKLCIAVLDDRVLITLSPTHARAEIQRYEKRAGDTEHHSLAAPGRYPPDAIEASSMDWSGLFGKLYDMARGFAPMLAQGGTLPFDPATLPSSSSFTRFFQPSYSWTKRTEQGLYTYSESSIGPETLVTLAALFAGFSQAPGGRPALLGGGAIDAPGSGRPSRRAAAPTSTGEADDPKTPQKKDEAREKTQATLRGIKTGIAVYRSQKSKVPAALASLLEGTESFPKGFLDSSTVPTDAWSREFRYVPDASESKFKLWSVGPDGIDEQGAGDDVLAP